MVKSTCVRCGTEVEKERPRKYCSRTCYSKSPVSSETKIKQSLAKKGIPKPDGFGATLSAAVKGKPRPWFAGEKNPNYGNKSRLTPEIQKRMKDACKKRGQPWSQSHRDRHSLLMLGNTNAMRGRKHTVESIASMSRAKKRQHEDGTMKWKPQKISAPERAIALWLTSMEIGFVQQFHIKGHALYYDFLLPEKNLIIEFNGDYWHANPRKYESGTMINLTGTGRVVVDSIWERDRRKAAVAVSHGFKIVHIWEMDFKSRGFKLIEDVINE